MLLLLELQPLSLYDLNICIYVYQRYVQVSAKRNATTFNGIRVLSPISVLRLCLSTVKKDIDIICKSIKSCYIFLCRHKHVSHAQQIHILPCKYGCQSGSTVLEPQFSQLPQQQSGTIQAAAVASDRNLAHCKCRFTLSSVIDNVNKR